MLGWHISWRSHATIVTWKGYKVWNASSVTQGRLLFNFRESSFNMTRGGDEDIEGGLRKFLDTRRGGSEKIVALGGGAPKICILQNQHMTSSYRSDGFQLNNLMTCATQLYHVVYRYNKCSLSNYYTLVHPKNALENCITTVSQVCHSVNH